MGIRPHRLRRERTSLGISDRESVAYTAGVAGPFVNENTVWNDVPDEPAAMELELRARVTWLSRQMDFWCTLEHDMVPSSGGGNWVARMWAPASAPGHHVTAELQERYVGLRMASRP